MAYNNGFPITYQNPYQQQNYYPQYQMQMPQQQQNINSGYVTVRSEQEARNYPVAPGASITFFNETEPYCYKKTMGNSPLDRPDFEIYEIIKKTSTPQTQNLPPTSNDNEKTDIYTTEQFKSEIEPILSRLDVLERKVVELEEKAKPKTKKIQEVENNESVD